MDQPPAIIDVYSDHGGALGERTTVTEWLKRSGINVRVIGLCDSACWWVFTLPRDQVCVSPAARLGSHTNLGEPNDQIAYQHGRDLIARGMAVECKQ